MGFHQLRSTRRFSAQAAGPNSVLVNDANWFFSPYNTLKSGSTYAQTTNPAHYQKLVFGGTSFNYLVNVASLVAAGVGANNYPTILYSVDSEAFTRYQIQSTDSTLTLASGRADINHTLDIILAGMFWNSNDLWNTPDLCFKVTGCTLDAGRSLSSPTLFADRMVIFTDSFGGGWELLGAGVTVANEDASQAFPLQLARAFRCEVGVVDYAGQGYITAVGTANVPALSTAWDHYMNGISRLVAGFFNPLPKYIVCTMGTNDGSNPQATVAALIAAWRIAAPLATIFIVIPPGQANLAGITAGVTAAADANTFLIDPQENMLVGQNTNGTHFNFRGSAKWTATVIRLMQAALGGTVSSAGVFNHPGMTGRMVA